MARADQAARLTPLHEWLRQESDASLRFRKQVKFAVGLNLLMTVIVSAAVVVGLVLLGKEVDLNRDVLRVVCTAQRHTVSEQKKSLKESVPLFRKLIPKRDLDAAIGRSRARIGVFEADLHALKCDRLNDGRSDRRRP